MFTKLCARTRSLVMLVAVTALALSGQVASATETAVTIPSLGFDMAATVTSFIGLVGAAIGIAVGLMFAVAVVVIGVKWILRGGKKA
jgi:hypothetical protein